MYHNVSQHWPSHTQTLSMTSINTMVIIWRHAVTPALFSYFTMISEVAMNLTGRSVVTMYHKVMSFTMTSIPTMDIMCLSNVKPVYIHNTDAAVNPGCVIRQGADGKRHPETDNTVKGFLTRLYCFYFISCSRNVQFSSVLCVFCACIVCFSCCLRSSGQHTAGQHVFSSR